MTYMQKATKQKLKRRLSIIEGQVRGIKKMVEDDTYCVDVITQTSALRHAISSLEDVMLAEHLSCCVVNQVQAGKQKKMHDEIVKIYQLAKKK